ncbi:MAG: peptidase domain-containing ABC transporter [Raineya sp.]|nr:peptidase domain-containing ABC transporter [Raineya sp.]MDW8297033.1 peptidase domain-containing ABC transporter [Raineya sp.]
MLNKFCCPKIWSWLLPKKISFIPQLESSDCGPACLAMLARYYGIKVNVKQIRQLGNLSRLGVSVKQLIEVANLLGMQAEAYKATLDELKQVLLPCILFWKQDHYVVLEKITFQKRNTIFHLLDPAYGKVKLFEEEFAAEWLCGQPKGVLVLFSKKDFEQTIDLPETNSQGNRIIISQILQFIKEKKVIYIVGILLILLTMLFNWYSPQIFQKLIDEGIVAQNLSQVTQLLLAQMALFLGNFIADSWSMIILTRFNLRLSENLQEKLFRYLTTLPLSYFDARISTETLNKIKDLGNVQEFITWRLVNLMLQLLNILVFGVLLYRLNQEVFAVYTLLTVLSIIWVIFFLKKRKTINYASFLTESKLNNNLYEFITKMPEIRIHQGHHRVVQKILDFISRLHHHRWRNLWLNLYQNTGVSLLGKLKDVAVVAICAYFIIAEQNLSLGVLMSASYIIGQLNTPINEWIYSFDDIQDFKIAQTRLELVYEQIPEKLPQKKYLIPQHIQSVSLRNVSFHYPAYAHQVILDNVSFTLRKGEKVAIVGSSGSGKTTLLRLMLGYYEPVKGEILLNHKPLQNYDIDAWRRLCGVVLQEGSLFSGTVAENIAFRTENINWQKVEKVARIACLHEDIMRLPMKYQTKVGSVGIGLSGGQQQRILIARALYHDPQILFFDEATSSLDASTEKAIVENLTEYLQDKTALIIAHRLSTVRNADRILVLEKGKIVEIGNHQELIQKKGLYYSLISNQLIL